MIAAKDVGKFHGDLPNRAPHGNLCPRFLTSDFETNIGTPVKNIQGLFRASVLQVQENRHLGIEFFNR